MRMTTIGIIRHGITDWNLKGIEQGRIDVPLNDEGKLQAIALAERLTAEEPWDLLISSELARAKETAEIISERLEMPISFLDARLIEMDSGEIEGTTEAERLEKWGVDWQRLDLAMESQDIAAQRGLEFFEEISKKFEGKRVLIISHASLIGATLKKILPEQICKVNLRNTSITILHRLDRNWECSLYNCIKHLNVIDISKKNNGFIMKE